MSTVLNTVQYFRVVRGRGNGDAHLNAQIDNIGKKFVCTHSEEKDNLN